MYKNILIPLDHSSFEDDAVETAASLAEMCNAKITLIQVLEILPLFQKDREAELKLLKQRSDNYLGPIKKQIQDRNISVEAIVKTGNPGLTVCNYIENNDVDLVVMPVYDLEKTNRIIVGAVAEKLFKYSPKPVLFVRSASKDILRGRNVLVVDDEPDILDIVEEELGMCVVHKAKDHDTALKFIEENRYDIVILDIMGVDGFDILKQTVKCAIPTVMLTAHALNKDALNKAARLGATAFLPKERMMDLELFLADVLKNNGKPVWKKLFERLSSYFETSFGWTKEDEESIVSEYGNFSD